MKGSKEVTSPATFAQSASYTKKLENFTISSAHGATGHLLGPNPQAAGRSLPGAYLCAGETDLVTVVSVLEILADKPGVILEDGDERLGASAWTACESASAEDRQPLRDDLDLSLAELRSHLRYGAVTHLSDLLLRRIRLGMWRPDLARELAPTLGPVLQEQLGWSVDRFDRELEQFDTELDAWTIEGVEKTETTP